jgi:hypothetical protein
MIEDRKKKYWIIIAVAINSTISSKQASKQKQKQKQTILQFDSIRFDSIPRRATKQAAGRTLEEEEKTQKRTKQ